MKSCNNIQKSNKEVYFFTLAIYKIVSDDSVPYGFCPLVSGQQTAIPNPGNIDNANVYVVTVKYVKIQWFWLFLQNCPQKST